ncbi:MAG: hypothetical protein V4514_14745 [Pseudomonadota bacterium]|uniref:hypothetical protein n=1 Tax=unclassified Phenylobacterium TaxID=2640670 RepID=UPI0006F35AEB|nr:MULTISPECIES: hypothetical protein [unclassified Phenylobacterium]KRB52865.1 hypothetical protein ASE02_00130 [Phenylobacterium sp. Root700]MBT9471085.1 hypothetical protein [Phenylobacterium sp.]
MQKSYQLAAVLLLLALAGCSRADVTRLATNIRSSAERTGAAAEATRTIDGLNNREGEGDVIRARPAQEAEAEAAAAAEPPPTPLWLQPGSPYAPTASTPAN